MTIPEARKHLEKYWNGESTLEEEKQLKHFFQTHSRDSLPQDLKQVASLFSFYDEESKQTTGDFQIPEPSAKENNGRRGLKSYWKYAAIIIVLIAAGFFFHASLKPSSTTVSETHIAQQSRKQAFKTTKKALRLVASNLNKGTSEMQKLALFDEVQQTIAGN